MPNLQLKDRIFFHLTNSLYFFDLLQSIWHLQLHYSFRTTHNAFQQCCCLFMFWLLFTVCHPRVLYNVDWAVYPVCDQVVSTAWVQEIWDLFKQDFRTTPNWYVLPFIFCCAMNHRTCMYM